MAPLVVKSHGSSAGDLPALSRGWMANALEIPVISYAEIFHKSPEVTEATAVKILDEIFPASATGIVKVTGLPPPSFESERNKTNTVVTQVM